MIKAAIGRGGGGSVNLTSEKILLNVLDQISSISHIQLKSSASCMLLEFSVKMIAAEWECGDTVSYL